MRLRSSKPSIKKSQIKVYNNINTLMDIYAGGEAPARRYATPGSGPASYRTRSSKAAIGPPKATVIPRRYNSHGPLDLVPPLPGDEEAKPSSAGLRRQPMSESNMTSVRAQNASYRQNLELGEAIKARPTNDDRLLPALSIAGSPGTPTIFSGAKELFQQSDDSLEDSGGESEDPAEEYRPTAPRRRVKKKNREPEQEDHIPFLRHTYRYHTPENRHPPPHPGRPGRRDDSSSPVPVKRFLPREPTPTISPLS
jgi:hypothetical protein